MVKSTHGAMSMMSRKMPKDEEMTPEPDVLHYVPDVWSNHTSMGAQQDHKALEIADA